MIINKMLKLCKKKKMIQIVSYGRHKFLAAGATAGYIDDDTATKWTADDCAIAIGIAEDNREGYILTSATHPPIDVSSMQEAVPMKYSLENCQPFILEDKRAFIVRKDKLSVFDEVQNKRYYLGYIRVSDENVEDDKLIIASDNFPVGIITPERVNLNSLKLYAMELYSGLDMSEKKGFFDAGGQLEIEEPAAESEDAE